MTVCIGLISLRQVSSKYGTGTAQQNQQEIHNGSVAAFFPEHPILQARTQLRHRPFEGGSRHHEPDAAEQTEDPENPGEVETNLVGKRLLTA
jgi:hypothetical protein